ncbi:hypothetical protein FHX57_007345 [Paraburkholderia tropica]|uniref:Uncharacterized protein n=1 Tax=Paraburkholderia tropica TaxID=92647 RepID=A0ABX5MCY6_9BURK|nr:hypothetical protein [Paraburkholderia tropica]MBB3004958.1 hypothetical protein [Paraburkholderia tropica]MBB6323246.1 hypothetical protein [Paraburkholderia tropica]PXX05044.1 hypothetical protein C7400_14410 [Paraburkholderia tropica]PZW70472.1 hypothetical protein C7399_14410 [Paraburkholderia tropica]
MPFRKALPVCDAPDPQRRKIPLLFDAFWMDVPLRPGPCRSAEAAKEAARVMADGLIRADVIAPET